MKTQFTTTFAAAWPLAIAAGLLGVTPNATAGKPGGGTTGPTYTYINLGTLGQPDGHGSDINASGLVTGYLYDAAHTCSAFAVLPKDTNLDGQPDLWFQDANGDGLNDLQVPLGRAPGTAGLVVNLKPLDINDHGQIVIHGWYGQPSTVLAFVLTPRDLDGDGSLEFFSPGPDGENTLMAPVTLPGIANQVIASSINNLGVVTVEDTALRNPDGSMRGPRCFVVSGKDLDGDGMADTWFEDSGSGTNALAQALGYVLDQSGRVSAVRPARINDAGEIAGRVPPYDSTSWGNPCLLRPRMTAQGLTWCVDDNADGLNDLVVKLLPVNTSTWGSADAISPSGKLVGWGTSNRAKSTDPMLWQVAQAGVTTTKLQKVGGGGWHTPKAINSSGVIVGGAGECAFVVQNGVTCDLRTLLDQGAALKDASMFASDINDAGQIVGSTDFSADNFAGGNPFIAVPMR